MYSFKKYCALLWLFFLSINCTKAQQNPVKTHLSLAEVWSRAEVNNKNIKMQDLRVEVAKEGVKDAKAERLPDIEAEGEYARVSNMPVYDNGLFHAHSQFEVVHTSYSFGAKAYLNLYNGHKTNLKIETEKEKMALAQEQLNLSLSEVRLKAAAYYLDLQRSYIFKALMLKDIQDQQKQLEEIRQLMKNGVVLKSDVLRAELKLSRQKMSLIQIQNDITIVNQKLAILMGERDDFYTEPDAAGQQELKVKTYPEYLEEAIDHSYEYRISEKETELSRLELKSVKANVSFKLGLFANYAYSYPQIQFYPYSIAMYGLGLSGIKASFPISAFYHNKHKTKAAEIAYLRQEVEHEETSDRVRQQVKEAYLRYKEAVTRIEVAKQNISQATENLRIVNNTYFNQLSLLTDLLDADTQLLQTRFDLAAAQIAAQLQYYQLQKAIGNL
ncbi:TolC family protein [Pedobacter nutrimenti]|jgi:outer membrane protein TolC|uniref:Outer membrane protein TolC n=1 Tax=Pedobacter nutrimenti TaxID=1241337 RepID=A0A318UEB4_9SPHI|nr:TolC family protein [Pedobacter nutrimenti]PYF72856.1 outer membrane protein TolC [Pedobacter nutrimenti]